MNHIKEETNIQNGKKTYRNSSVTKVIQIMIPSNG